MKVSGDWTTGSTSIGGKTVATLTDAQDATAAVEYGYPYGEVIFDIASTDPQIAGKLIGALP